MTPESALATIPGFSHAVIGMTLADGPTNHTVLIDHLGTKYVMRIDKPATAELGLDRFKEEEICRMVGSAGLAPIPVYYDHEKGISLRIFASGTNWLESDLRRNSWLKKLALLFRRVHRMPEVDLVFDPGSAIRRYAEQLGTPEASELADKALVLLGKTRELQDRTCLCHNDSVNYNILETEKKATLLIDWEFAGMGDPYFDLAVVVQHHSLGQKLGHAFLNAYLERKATHAELERLWKNCAFYAALLELWTLRVKEL
jgi:thiamine kinase-like enzyme